MIKNKKIISILTGLTIVTAGFNLCGFSSLASNSAFDAISKGVTATTGYTIERGDVDTEADPAELFKSGVGVEQIISSVDCLSKQDFLDLMEDLSINRIPGEKENWGYDKLGIANVSESLNIRKEPSAGSEKVGELPANAACEILDFKADWLHVRSGKVEGYVSSEYVLFGEEAKEKALEVQTLTATVIANALKVRKQPDTSHGTWALVYNGTSLPVREILDNGWVSVEFGDGEDDAFVSGDYVDVAYTLDVALNMNEVLYGKGVTDAGIDLANRAIQYVGCPYVYGGNSLTNGTDCSGFTMLLMKKYGISLPHSARAQSKMGTAVDLDEVRPGDLIFYSDSTGVNHVTVYIGGGKVCHASTPTKGIIITNINYRTATCARRFF